jgi:hypothetical protein
MYCVYRIFIEEYFPGRGWCDDGYIYGTDRLKVQKEAERRVMLCYNGQERTRAGEPKIVVVHETFLRDLKRTPVLSTIKGLHPADMGFLSDYNASRRSHRKPLADVQHLKNTSAPLVAA